jgi:hypothetical protein
LLEQATGGSLAKDTSTNVLNLLANFVHLSFHEREVSTRKL